VTVVAQRRQHHIVALAEFGPLPVRCRCGELVRSLDQYVGVVHHKDENPANNVPENLEIMHHSCHVRHHSTGVCRSLATRLKMRAAKLGKRHTPETIERIRQKKLGHKQSPECVAKRVAKLKGHKTSLETRKKISDANRGRTLSEQQKKLLSDMWRGKLVGAALLQSRCLTCGKIGSRGPMGMHAKHKAHEVVPHE
jgi:HNH endonuclease/NUMOD3 motif